jgi:hypothetical protein
MTTEQAASKQCRFSTMTRAELIDALDRSTASIVRLMESIESMRAELRQLRRESKHDNSNDSTRAWNGRQAHLCKHCGEMTGLL